MEKIEPVVRKKLKLFLRKEQFYLHRLKYPDYQKLKKKPKQMFLRSIFFSYVEISRWQLYQKNQVYLFHGETLLWIRSSILKSSNFWTFPTIMLLRRRKKSQQFQPNGLPQIECFRLRTWWSKTSLRLRRILSEKNRLFHIFEHFCDFETISILVEGYKNLNI